MSTHNLCFDQKYVKYRIFLSENFYFLVVKFSVYLNRLVFLMQESCPLSDMAEIHSSVFIHLNL